MRLRLLEPQNLEWGHAQDLVSEKYKEVFDAEVSPNPDKFLALFDEADELLSCCGISYAKGNPFFSETYLESPAEQAISACEQRPVSRNDVLEVGSLAAKTKLGGLELIRVLPVVVWAQGRRYALLTATSQLSRMMRAASVPMIKICDADIARISDAERERWGRYYATRPFTGYVNVAELAGAYFSTVGTYLFRNLDVQVSSQSREIA
ncbi:thermostable hemolysin [Agaribacterium haliotis]|uniref:thermostable hemolysin n=1 Tax=Agaribacterium haliotis TaxID=2013869 RepID=UPI000BB58369|nr:thermostable hemolysin [Agaribacterium haliotis]